MTQNLIFLNFCGYFVLLVTFELISNHPNIDNPHWLRNHVQWITDKVFTEKLMV